MSLLLSSAPSALLLAAARGARLLPGFSDALPAAAAAGRAPACARPFSGSAAAAAAASPWGDYPASRPRRVVVTGLGLVTPLGVGVQASWAGLMEGRSAVRALTPEDLPEARAWPPAPTFAALLVFRRCSALQQRAAAAPFARGTRRHPPS
jgi:hypothetical protein